MAAYLRRAAVVVLVLGLFATGEEGWVTNRGGTTINLFNPATNTELSGSPITVGTAPIDIAADQADADNPGKLFVANSGSGTVSVVDAANRFVLGTITGDSGFGAFLVPSGITRAFAGTVGPTIAVVDQQTVGGTQRSTLRFIHPSTNSVVDGFVDISLSPRYSDVVFTSNGRFWIADDGDNGIVVVRLGAFAGPPFPSTLSRTLIYTGVGEYADFIYDDAATPTFLLDPKRLATNGTDRVVVADGGSDLLTIIDATYPGDAENTAIVLNVDLGLAAGMVCVDVEIVGTKIYVTTNDPAKPLVVRSLTTGALIKDFTAAEIPTTVGGIGRSLDGSKIYVGGGTGLATIYEISTVTDLVTATLPGFTGGVFPFAFQLGANAAGGDPFFGGGGGDDGGGGGCGLLGLEAVLLLGLLALRRRGP
jgi:YVTN family beta-propeller protein